MKQTAMACPTDRLNYDRIAHLYDEPGRDYQVDPRLVEFLKDKTDPMLSHLQILDLGCGTGKQLAANYREFPGVQMTGLDLFHGMLARARARCSDVRWVQGDNVNPPFADAGFDYITNQFSYHHVRDKHRLIAAIFRILKPAGRLVITNLDPWSMPEWIVYTCFPPARQRDRSDFLPTDELTDRMQEAGFCNVRLERKCSRSEENLSDFLEYVSQRHRTSQLMVIQDDEYELGMAELKARIANVGPDFRVSSELCLVWICGDKPR